MANHRRSFNLPMSGNVTSIALAYGNGSIALLSDCGRREAKRSFPVAHRSFLYALQQATVVLGSKRRSIDSFVVSPIIEHTDSLLQREIQRDLVATTPKKGVVATKLK